ncbi:MAG TPA: rRNA maturation RNase YbeY [Chitinophagaceae bacterium]
MIKFLNHDRSFHSREKTAIRHFIENLFKREGRETGCIQYIFCSDDYLLGINRDFLNHDYYTDIITFDLSDREKVEAEIYISVERVKDNARTFGTGYRQEMLRVIFHGALHLCGYGDKTKREITLMRQKESEYLRLFEKANPRP